MLFRSKKGFAFFAAAWSAANMLHALAGSWTDLVLFRMLLGGAEAALVPAGMKAITEWFPMKERSIATGWFSAGTAFGSAIAPPLIFFITLFGSWHWAFVVTGAVGLLWSIAWLLCYDAPTRHRAITAAEEGADYVAFGAFFPTTTKAPKARAPLDLLTWWSELMVVPCVAIGGITVENCGPLIAAGADFLAVAAGVWDYPTGPAAAVKAFNTLFA